MNPSRETEKWIHELLDGSITAEIQAKLQEVLLEDPKARRLYYDLLCTDQMLVDLHGTPGRAAAPEEASADKTVPFTPAAPPRRHRIWQAAAAALVLCAAGLVWKISRPYPVALSSSPGSHFTIDGSDSTAVRLKPGQRLDVTDGQVTVRFSSSSEASLTAPAGMTLADADGTVIVRHGQAGFITTSDNSGLRVMAAGAIIQPAVSHFTVQFSGPHTCLISVASGQVQVDRQDGKGMTILQANETLDSRDSTTPAATGTLVFEDDFSDPAGTPLDGKPADTGGPWKVIGELLPTKVGNGRLDTSEGFKNIRADFAPAATRNTRHVTELTALTVPPARMWDKRERLGGIEGITLKATDGTSLCTAFATAGDGHRWKLRNDITGQESAATGITVFEERSIVLRCDPIAGRISFHADGHQLTELPFQSDKTPASLAIDNLDGGDIAVKRISVRIVNP
ncbi:hypothetical protein [Luteolibacter sp. LG18]|uniref:hypothetical protein n=1 Tax=Luteolibacter sp. LG18 TaxID=2819286 RepID=UPI002B2BEC99|nr:hypothetical protein llg_29400 [Luteolibacter sp. LG18]